MLVLVVMLFGLGFGLLWRSCVKKRRVILLSPFVIFLFPTVGDNIRARYVLIRLGGQQKESRPDDETRNTKQSAQSTSRCSTMLTTTFTLFAALTSSVVSLSTPPRRRLPKLVLLDRDGVINSDVGAPGVICKSQFELTPNAGRAIGSLKRHGCRVAVITNQSCIGKGLLTIEELDAIHCEMKTLLVQQDTDAIIDVVYFCISADENDPRKKPNAGMIKEACRDFGIDPIDCAFVGDTLTDLQAAKSGGLQQRILVETGYGFGLMCEISACTPAKLVDGVMLEQVNGVSSELMGVAPFVYATNLAEAVNSILEC